MKTEELKLSKIIESGLDKKEDLNCSETILKAANISYNMKLDKTALKLAAGFGGGMGIESTCGALTGAVMVLSHLFVTERGHESDYIRDLNQHVSNGNYDLIQGLEAQQLVIDTITQNWKDRGVQLSIDEACVLVEKHLTDVELPKLERIREITAKRAGSKEVKKLEVTRPVKKTLKNKAATKAPVRKVRGRISQEEAMADAIALEDALWE